MSEDPKIEYLTHIQNQTAATDLVVKGVQLVLSRGVEGIKEVAETHPEMILVALKSMSDLIEMSQEQICGLVEMNLGLLDDLEAIGDAITKVVE